MRYDGEHVTALLDGLADPRPVFTEQGPPLGEGLRYPKNPYRFGDGLYRGPRSDFTVGAVRLTAGIGNALRGSIARLAVWDRALDFASLMAVVHEWMPAGEPLVRFDWWRPDAGPAGAGGATGARGPLADGGMRVRDGSGRSVTVHQGRVCCAAGGADAVLLADTPGLTAGMLREIRVAGPSSPAQVRGALVVDGRLWTCEPVAAGADAVFDIPAGSWRPHGQAAAPSGLDLPHRTPIAACGIVLGAGPSVSVGEVSLWPRPRSRRPVTAHPA